MTTAQVFQESIRTAIFGMGLVLGTLFILSLALDLMRIIFDPKSKVKKNEAVIVENTVEQIQTESETIDSEDNAQLIAVITAALATYLGTPITSVKVGTIRKIHEKTPIWGMESRIYNINNKL
ncbi:MAG: OadG family protein [Tepidanaerobacteraceae bacterium]